MDFFLQTATTATATRIRKITTTTSDTTADYIPRDIVSVICEYLDGRTLWSVRLLSHDWYTIALNNTLWKTLYSKRWQEVIHVKESCCCWWMNYIDRDSMLQFKSLTPTKLMNTWTCLDEQMDSVTKSYQHAKSIVVGISSDSYEDVVHSTIFNDDKNSSQIGLSPVRMLQYLLKKTLNQNEREEQKLVKSILKMEDQKSTFNSKEKIFDLIELCLRTLRNSPSNVTALFALTKCFSTLAKYRLVIVYCTECLNCITSQPKNIEEARSKMGQILFLRGYASYKHHNYINSLQDYNDSISLGFTKTGVYYCRMFNYIKLKRVDLAYEDARRMQDHPLAKRFPSAKLGEYCFKSGLYEDAKRFFLLSNNKKNRSVVFKRLFEIEYKLGEYLSALEQWKKLTEYLQESDAINLRLYQKYYRKEVKKCYRETGIQQFKADKLKSCLKNFSCAILTDLKQFSTNTTIGNMLAKIAEGNIYNLAKACRKQVSVSVNDSVVAKSIYYLLWATLFKQLEQSDKESLPECLKSKPCSEYQTKYLNLALKNNPGMQKKLKSLLTSVLQEVPTATRSSI